MINRLIKFRVFDKKKKVFLKPYRNYYFYSSDDKNIVYGYSYFVDSELNGNRYSVQQSTGLFSLKKKLIYEGDKVSCYSSNGEKRKGTVIWKDEICGFALKLMGKKDKIRDWACLWDFSHFKLC